MKETKINFVNIDWSKQPKRKVKKGVSFRKKDWFTLVLFIFLVVALLSQVMGLY